MTEAQCPHWKCTDNLKSDCRDQNLPRYYCVRSDAVLDVYTGIRPAVMRFAAAMELVLRKNDYKGGWREIGDYKILERAYEKLEECRREMRESKSGAMRRASREMVDVANFCMMFFDNLYSMPGNDEYLENKLKELRQHKEREQR